MKKRIIEKTERVQFDSVTDKLVRVELDTVQLAVEKAHRELDRLMKDMTVAQCERFAGRMAEVVRGMQRGDVK